MNAKSGSTNLSRPPYITNQGVCNYWYIDSHSFILTVIVESVLGRNSSEYV